MADEPASKPKRRVRNPETFRERAIKAAESEGQPKRGSRIKAAGGKVVRPVTRPAGAIVRSSVFKKQPFRFIGKVLRLIGRVIFPKYFRESWKELKLVKWPSWQQSRALTGAVLVFAVIFGAAIAAVDWGLDRLFKDVLLK